MGWYSGSGYYLSTGSLFPSDELIGNYEKLQENNHNAVDRSCVRSPHFFKINGEYIDFDLMNLELNTPDNQVEENLK